MMTTPGIKTTEFWLTILGAVYIALLNSGAIPHGDTVTTIINTVAAALLAVGYTWARAWVKTKGV